MKFISMPRANGNTLVLILWCTTSKTQGRLFLKISPKTLDIHIIFPSFVVHLALHVSKTFVGDENTDPL